MLYRPCLNSDRDTQSQTPRIYQVILPPVSPTPASNQCPFLLFVGVGRETKQPFQVITNSEKESTSTRRWTIMAIQKRQSSTSNNAGLKTNKTASLQKEQQHFSFLHTHPTLPLKRNIFYGYPFLSAAFVTIGLCLHRDARGSPFSSCLITP